MKGIRGRVYTADLGYGPMPWLIVSNNARNLKLPDVLAVRITTAAKKLDLPTIVELGQSDPLPGFILCDDIVHIDHDELLRDLGALSPTTMSTVGMGLRAAVAL